MQRAAQGAEPRLLDFASNLPANPSSSAPSCVSWASYLPSLRLSLLLGKMETLAGDRSELFGVGSTDPTGKVSTQSAQDKCQGHCCRRGERVKARRFLIVK